MCEKILFTLFFLFWFVLGGLLLYLFMRLAGGNFVFLSQNGFKELTI